MRAYKDESGGSYFLVEKLCEQVKCHRNVLDQNKTDLNEIEYRQKLDAIFKKMKRNKALMKSEKALIEKENEDIAKDKEKRKIKIEEDKEKRRIKEEEKKAKQDLEQKKEEEIN